MVDFSKTSTSFQGLNPNIQIISSYETSVDSKMLRVHLYLTYFLLCKRVSFAEVTMDPENPSKSKADSLVTSFFNDTVSYAGFFNITHTSHDDRLFFWFFPHRNEKAPLIVWIQGQPGLSSLYGLFEEHGPYQIDETSMQIIRRKYALTNTYHVLYLDPEIYCGFSNTESSSDLYHSLDHIPAQIYSILDQFFYIFTEYRANDLYIAGASVNCRILCELARCDLDDISGSEKVNLKGVIIGGGLFTPEQTFHYLYTLHWTGLLDTHKSYFEYRRKHYNIVRFIQAQKDRLAMEEIGSILSKLRRQGYKTMYDLRDPTTMSESYVPDFVTSPQIRTALHVSNRTFQNETLIIVKDGLLPVGKLYSRVFSYYKILLYHGQFDLLSSYAHSSIYLTSLKWSHILEYYNAKQVNWIHNGDLLGYWTKAGNLTHVMIRNAGHFVGKSQPEALYMLFDNFIGNKFTVNGSYH